MKLIPTKDLPMLPYTISYETNGNRMEFLMRAKAKQDLQLEKIIITKNGKVYFHMLCGRYENLTRRVQTNISSIEDGIAFVNEYLCQTAFQLNALRGKGFTGYIEIEYLEGSRIMSSSKDEYEIHGTRGMKWKYIPKTDTFYTLVDTKLPGEKPKEILEFDVHIIPWQVVELAKAEKRSRKEL